MQYHRSPFPGPVQALACGQGMPRQSSHHNSLSRSTGATGYRRPGGGLSPSQLQPADIARSRAQERTQEVAESKSRGTSDPTGNARRITQPSVIANAMPCGSGSVRTSPSQLQQHSAQLRPHSRSSAGGQAQTPTQASAIGSLGDSCGCGGARAVGSRVLNAVNGSSAAQVPSTNRHLFGGLQQQQQYDSMTPFGGLQPHRPQVGRPMGSHDEDRSLRVPLEQMRRSQQQLQAGKQIWNDEYQTRHSMEANNNGRRGRTPYGHRVCSRYIEEAAGEDREDSPRHVEDNLFKACVSELHQKLAQTTDEYFRTRRTKPLSEEWQLFDERRYDRFPLEERQKNGIENFKAQKASCGDTSPTAVSTFVYSFCSTGCLFDRLYCKSCQSSNLQDKANALQNFISTSEREADDSRSSHRDAAKRLQKAQTVDGSQALLFAVKFMYDIADIFGTELLSKNYWRPLFVTCVLIADKYVTDRPMKASHIADNLYPILKLKDIKHLEEFICKMLWTGELKLPKVQAFDGYKRQLDQVQIHPAIEDTYQVLIAKAQCGTEFRTGQRCQNRPYQESAGYRQQQQQQAALHAPSPAGSAQDIPTRAVSARLATYRSAATPQAQVNDNSPSRSVAQAKEPFPEPQPQEEEPRTLTNFSRHTKSVPKPSAMSDASLAFPTAETMRSSPSAPTGCGCGFNRGAPPPNPKQPAQPTRSTMPQPRGRIENVRDTTVKAQSADRANPDRADGDNSNCNSGAHPPGSTNRSNQQSPRNHAAHVVSDRSRIGAGRQNLGNFQRSGNTSQSPPPRSAVSPLMHQVNAEPVSPSNASTSATPSNVASTSATPQNLTPTYGGSSAGGLSLQNSTSLGSSGTRASNMSSSASSAVNCRPSPALGRPSPAGGGAPQTRKTVGGAIAPRTTAAAEEACRRSPSADVLNPQRPKIQQPARPGFGNAGAPPPVMGGRNGGSPCQSGASNAAPGMLGLNNFRGRSTSPSSPQPGDLHQQMTARGSRSNVAAVPLGPHRMSGGYTGFHPQRS